MFGAPTPRRGEVIADKTDFDGTATAPAVISTMPFETARAEMLSLLGGGAPLVVLTGDAGSGKSLLLRSLEAAIAAGGGGVRRLDRGDLLAADEPGDILLVDEATRADPETIAAILHRGVQMVLVLLPEDAARPGAANADAAIVRLHRLPPTEAHAFLARHPRLAGREISAAARDAIVGAAQGLPRWLSVLAGTAALEASLDGSDRIEARHAHRAIEMHQLTAGTEAAGREQEGAPSPVAAAATPASIVPVPGPLAADVNMPAVSASPPDAPAAEDEPRSRSSRKLLLAGAAALLLAGGGIGALVAQMMDSKRAAEPSPEPAAAGPKVARPPKATSAAAPVRPAPPERKLVPAPTVPPRPASPVAAAAPAAPTAPATPAAPAAVPPAPKPPRAPVVILEYSRATPGAAAAADRIAAFLRARGHDVVARRAVVGPISIAETRYPAGLEDAAAAADAAVGSALRAYEPGARSRLARSRTPSGTIIVRVPDAAASAARPLHLDAPPP